jgi:hypothetical protein
LLSRPVDAGRGGVQKVYQFTATVRRRREDVGGDSFQAIDVKDPDGKPCGGMVDLVARYADVIVLMDSLTRQLEIRPDNLTLVEEREPG